MTLLPIVCSANVENGSNQVAVTGTDASTGLAVLLTDINCRPNATVFLAGVGYLVKARVDTTHFQIERNYEDANAIGVSCSVSPFTPEMANRAELATSLRTYSARDALLKARGNGLHYVSLGATGTADPGPGKVSYVGASWAAATCLCIDVLDAAGMNRAGLIDRWAAGDTLTVESIATSAYVAYELTRPPTNEGPDAWRKLLEFVLIASDGAIVDSEDARLVWTPGGAPGPGYVTDAEVADIAGRAVHDAAAAGFKVLVLDVGGADAGRAAIYRRVGAAGNWVLVMFFTGPQGGQGEKGWSPLYADEADGARVVSKLSGYVGGAGTAPTDHVGEYLKADGSFTAVKAEALDRRGAAGPPGLDGASQFNRVRVVAIANVNLANGLENGDTIDGVTLTTNDEVLLTGQTAHAENGIYVVVASGAASRKAAFSTYDAMPGVYVSVMEGTVNADTLWRCTSNKGGSLGATALVFSQSGSSAGSPTPPQGRLTLQSGVPVMTTTQSAKTTIYYTPHVGAYIPLYNGTAFTPTKFAELSAATTDATKSPAAIGASKVNDWFVWNDSGTLRLSHGPDWTNDTTRSAGSALVMVDGVLLNGNTITNGPAIYRGTYVGTTRSNASSQLDWILPTAAGAAPFLFVWNAYNRHAIAVMASHGSNYTYSTASVRQIGGSSTNQINFVCGLAEDGVEASFNVVTTLSAVVAAYKEYYVALDTTTGTAFAGSCQNNAAVAAQFSVALRAAFAPQLGVHFITANELGDGVNNNTVFGGAYNALIGRLQA